MSQRGKIATDKRLPRYVPPEVVPWPRVDGKPVHTNEVMEDALGLTPLIAGWNQQGFYVSRSTTPDVLKAHIKTIDWGRVQVIDRRYDIKARGYVVSRYTSAYWVTEARFMRLMRQCFRHVPASKFYAECLAARNTMEGKKEYSSGSL